MATTEENTQISARATQQLVDKLPAAADTSGPTLGELISETGVYPVLTRRDLEAIIQMLRSPREPNAALKRASERYAKEFAHGNYVRQADEDS